MNKESMARKCITNTTTELPGDFPSTLQVVWKEAQAEPGLRGGSSSKVIWPTAQVLPVSVRKHRAGRLRQMSIRTLICVCHLPPPSWGRPGSSVSDSKLCRPLQYNSLEVKLSNVSQILSGKWYSIQITDCSFTLVGIFGVYKYKMMKAAAELSNYKNIEYWCVNYYYLQNTQCDFLCINWGKGKIMLTGNYQILSQCP